MVDFKILMIVKFMDKYSDLVQKGHPEYNDEQLYQHARLVTAAVLAKIHTIDWTTQLLKNNVLLAAMRINWYYLYTYIYAQHY